MMGSVNLFAQGDLVQGIRLNDVEFVQSLGTNTSAVLQADQGLEKTALTAIRLSEYLRPKALEHGVSLIIEGSDIYAAGPYSNIERAAGEAVNDVTGVPIVSVSNAAVDRLLRLNGIMTAKLMNDSYEAARYIEGLEVASQKVVPYPEDIEQNQPFRAASSSRTLYHGELDTETPYQNCCCNTGGAELWASVYGANNVTREYKGFSRHDSKQWGILLGADWRSDSTVFGAYYSYGTMDFSCLRTNIDSDDHTFGAYLRWDSRLMSGYSLLNANFTFSDYSATGTLLEPSEYDGTQGSIYFEKGWECLTGRCGFINPYVALQYVGYESNPDTYTPFGLVHVTDVTQDSLRSILGLRMGRLLHCELATLNLNMSLAWVHEYADTEGSFSTSLFNQNVVMRGNGGGRDWLEMTLGAGCALTESTTISADYYLLINGYTTNNAASVTLTYSF